MDGEVERKQRGIKVAPLLILQGEERAFNVFMLFSLCISLLKDALYEIAVYFPFCAFGCDAIYATIFVFLMVGLWRCAFNVDKSKWGYGCRIIVIVWIYISWSSFSWEFSKGESYFLTEVWMNSAHGQTYGKAKAECTQEGKNAFEDKNKENGHALKNAFWAFAVTEDCFDKKEQEYIKNGYPR